MCATPALSGRDRDHVAQGGDDADGKEDAYMRRHDVSDGRYKYGIERP